MLMAGLKFEPILACGTLLIAIQIGRASWLVCAVVTFSQYSNNDTIGV